MYLLYCSDTFATHQEEEEEEYSEQSLCARLAGSVRVAQTVYARLTAQEAEQAAISSDLYDDYGTDADNNANHNDVTYNADTQKFVEGSELTLTQMLYDTAHTGEALAIGVSRVFQKSMLFYHNTIAREYVSHLCGNKSDGCSEIDVEQEEAFEHLRQNVGVLFEDRTLITSHLVQKRAHELVEDAKFITNTVQILRSTLERCRARIVHHLLHSKTSASVEQILGHGHRRSCVARAVAAILRQSRVIDDRINLSQRRRENEFTLLEAVTQYGMSFEEPSGVGRHLKF